MYVDILLTVIYTMSTRAATYSLPLIYAPIEKVNNLLIIHFFYYLVGSKTKQNVIFNYSSLYLSNEFSSTSRGEDEVTFICSFYGSLWIHSNK